MAGTQIPPSMTNLSAPPNAPPARWQPILPAAPRPPLPATRPVDPVPIQSGRNSGPLILGIVTLHRPDWTKRTGRTSPRPSYRCPEPTPLPQGHTSPVMINTRFSQISDGLTARTHHRHNDFSMRQRCSFGDTAPAIAAFQIAALSSSHSHFCRPKRKKPAKANHALRVLSPDPFVLLTLSLCHKEKNKSRTFSRKPEKVPRKSSVQREDHIYQYFGHDHPIPPPKPSSQKEPEPGSFCGRLSRPISRAIRQPCQSLPVPGG